LENRKDIKVKPLNFYSKDMTVAKDQLAHNHLKLSYQRDSVTDLDQKHKKWAQEDSVSWLSPSFKFIFNEVKNKNKDWNMG